MKIFLAGATGVVGRALLPMLLEAGHEVAAMTSSADRAAELEAVGATPVVCDVFDGERLREQVTAAAPEVVVNQLTRLPQRMNPRDRDSYRANDRVRTEGARNLAAAAAAAGARRQVAQSIAFATRPSGPPVLDEDAPLYDGAAEPWGSAVAAVRALEQSTCEGGTEGVVLRYGFFYGPGTAFAPGGQRHEEIAARRFPLLGGGRAVWSFVHVEDAASAALAALDGGGPGIYNVCDDAPAPVIEWLPAYAKAIGAKPPLRIPTVVGRVAAGPIAVHYATTLRGASNARFTGAFGWRPAYGSWRRGFVEGLPERAECPGGRSS